MSDLESKTPATQPPASSTAVEEPIPNPGLPAHEPRPTDVDPAAERRAERQVATMFVLSTVFAVLFCVAYFAFEIGENTDTFLGLGTSHVALGTTLGLSLLLLGIGAIQWARKLMSDVEMVEKRHPARSSQEDRDVSIAALNAGIEDSGIARRPLIRNTLLGALGALGLPLIVGLRDLGPLPGTALERTVWERGMRLVNDVSGVPIRPDEIELGTLINGQPAIFYETDAEGEPLLTDYEILVEKAKAAIIIVRMEPDEITHVPGRENWSIDGIVCYSKICTHVGCPISLYEQQTHHVLCPCHQSTFDLADGARVLFGPAARPLPQLPLAVDSEGYLIAQRDFDEPVGPSYWERG